MKIPPTSPRGEEAPWEVHGQHQFGNHHDWTFLGPLPHEL